jgi:hypothetical protein
MPVATSTVPSLTDTLVLLSAEHTPDNNICRRLLYHQVQGGFHYLTRDWWYACRNPPSRPLTHPSQSFPTRISYGQLLIETPSYPCICASPLVGRLRCGSSVLRTEIELAYLPSHHPSRVTHLEGETFPRVSNLHSRYQRSARVTELCFWLFVVNARPTQKDWFHSPYFKTWVVGSGIAILYMPIVTIATHSDPLKVRHHPPREFCADTPF